MKNFAKLIKLTLVVAISTVMFSCSDDDNRAPESNTIAAIAARNPNFTTLVAALDRAGLVQTLDQNGPFTVFAPTNAAFNDFLADNGFTSLNDIPVDALREVLLNHVVSGTNLSTSLSTGYVKTLATGGASQTNTLSMFINLNSGVTVNGISVR
nr:fasciclin domain-containing protein [Flavobacterium sp.]